MKAALEKVKGGFFTQDLFQSTLKVALGNMEWDSARHFVASPYYKGISFSTPTKRSNESFLDHATKIYCCGWMY